MSDAKRREPPQPVRYAKLLFVAAGLVTLSLLFSTARARLLFTLLSGWCGSAVLAHFAWAYRRASRRGLSQAGVAQGRIVERTESDGSLSFTMPAGGTEPWAIDAFILWATSAAAATAGAVLDSGDRALIAFLATMLAVLGFRLASAASDRLRLEISTHGWSVDALAGGRMIQRSGLDALLPELLRDALVLWSSEGRVGVLRGELEPEERAWLAERLTALVAQSSAISAEAYRELYQREPDRQRQEQKAERD
jgi:hypothetical protein